MHLGIGMVVIVEIGFILADRFQNNIELSTTISILKFIQISGYGTLICNFLVRRTPQHPKLLNPPDLMNLQGSHCFPTIFCWDWHYEVTINDDLRFKYCKDGY